MADLDKPLRIGIAEDHWVTLRGIHALISELENMEVTALCQTEQEVYDALAKDPELDVFILDIRLQEELAGIALTQYIQTHHPNTRVLVLTMSDDLVLIRRMIEAGAKGYLLKNTTLEEMRDAINILMQGGEYYCSRVGEVILQDVLRSAQDKDEEPYRRTVKLTPREEEILNLVGQERSTQEIADVLNISSRTVENHRRNLVQKVGARNTIGLIKYAIRHGYFTSLLLGLLGLDFAQVLVLPLF